MSPRPPAWSRGVARRNETAATQSGPPPGRAGGWRVERETGPAGALHQGSAAAVASARGAARRLVRILRCDPPCVVLGSRQGPADVDADAAQRAGFDVARRRSGGGAVLMGPAEAVWVDVVVPAGDPLWERDVGRSAAWLGATWLEALRAAGEGTGEVWAGRSTHGRWEDLICFAGLAPGEVLLGGRKVVGISQRRTAAATLLQSALLVRWEPGTLVGVLALGEAERTDASSQIASAAAGVGEQKAAETLRAFLSILGA